jgi:hypothetical protein
VNPDGTPGNFVGGPGTKLPRAGYLQQEVLGDDGHCTDYDNYFASNAADLQTLADYYKIGAVITFQGLAPDPKAGYQLQVHYTEHPSGYCLPLSDAEQSPSCPK